MNDKSKSTVARVDIFLFIFSLRSFLKGIKTTNIPRGTRFLLIKLNRFCSQITVPELTHRGFN